LLLGVVFGAGAGVLANVGGLQHGSLSFLIDHVAHPAGQIFLRALFMLVVPLLFSALVMGVASLDLQHLGRIGARTFGYTIVVSIISVGIGLLLVNVVRPGDGVPRELLVQGGAAPKLAAAPSAVDVFIAMVPDNPIKAAANGDMIGWIVFALCFGIALAHTRTDAAQALQRGIQGLYDVSMTLIDAVLKLAPLGVGALLFTMLSRLGTGILAQLAAYVLVVIAGLAVHMFGVYALALRFLSHRSPLAFYRDVRLAMLTAFSTASSSATLPTALRVADENLRLPKHVSRFVLTAGSTMNQNGTALFEGVTVLFLAQLYGIELSLTQQAVVMGISVLGGIGTAGVPAGSLPVIAMILGMLHIPAEGLALILGVDRLLDMCRTTVNVTGDLAAAVYVASREPSDSV
jgi:dicarboxylate/amino acid:cation (Na+ or H+) symporter, DAACS family